ncbi:hypothetical protein [Nannocystis pusilla]|uniref:Uncharacterized protein n=1 Tax=Nannocystis pusilla TaxID=889268 RepID=A0ABS7TZX3_9BACT|nr:hypothetical protein [Nannocystis pusilla]MBZ5713834.1 hypothetical protein [Nannocystis pusilla]
MRSAVLTVCVCFGVGLGLTSTTPVAHACSCVSDTVLVLRLAGIHGDAEHAAEQAFWPDEGSAAGSGKDAALELIPSDAEPQVRLVLEGVQ